LKVKVLNGEELTTIGIGGKREVFFPKSLEELLKLDLKEFKFIGGGSNSVLKEKGPPLISLKGFNYLIYKGELLTLGSGVPLSAVLKEQLRRGFSLFEFLSGIPKATVGGLIAQNAGAFGFEVKEFLERVLYIDFEGQIREIREFSSFNYRESPFPKEGVVIEATFKIRKESNIRKRIRSFLLKRKNKQPSFYLKTAGSTFKNPKGESAGKLLDICGFKGFKLKNLKFSEKHANFLINTGKATFSEFTDIVETAREKVKEEFGIELSLEVKVL